MPTWKAGVPGGGGPDGGLGGGTTGAPGEGLGPGGTTAL